MSQLGALYYYKPTSRKQGCTFYPDIRDVKQRVAVRITKSELFSTILAMVDYTCQGQINIDYINDKLPKCDIIVIFKDTEQSYGFILAFIDNNEFYIDLICSTRGYGSRMLEFFIKEATENRGIHSIGLSAIPTVLAYYPRFGFSHRHNCRESGIGLPEKIKARMRAKTPMPTTAEEAYNDDDFSSYMATLRDNGYGVVTGECSKTPLTKKALTDGDCGAHGYYMKYCVPK